MDIDKLARTVQSDPYNLAALLMLVNTLRRKGEKPIIFKAFFEDDSYLDSCEVRAEFYSYDKRATEEYLVNNFVNFTEDRDVIEIHEAAKKVYEEEGFDAWVKYIEKRHSGWCYVGILPIEEFV